MKCGFLSASHLAASACARARTRPRIEHAFAAARRIEVGGFTTAKKFCAGRLREARPTARRGAKRANQCQPIRARRRRFDGACGASRQRASGDFRFRFGCARVARRNFPRARAPTQRRAQIPIRFFRRSLTACGLALPPDAFITWPTNQPIAFGLVLASATLSGFLAMIVVDELFDRRNVGHLLQSARFDDRARVAALVPDDLEHVLGDLAGDRAVGRSDRGWRRAAPQSPATRQCLLPSLLSRPASSLMTQLAASFGSRFLPAPAPHALDDRFEKFGGLALGDEHAGVVA